MKNKTSLEESRDGKKHKISAMRDTYISLAIFDSGDVTWPSLFLEIVIVWSYATENFPVQFGWKQFFAMIFKLMENFNFLSLVIREKLFFISNTRDTGSSEGNIRVEPVTSPNVSGLVIG